MISDADMSRPMLGQPFGGVTMAQVSRVDDPEGLGRVTVLFHGSGETTESGWLQVMSFYGGPDSGAFFLPTEGDSVLVSFADGDAKQGFVLGFLWNGNIRPPIEGAARQREVRVIKTRQGKQLVFDDSKDGQLTLIDENQNKVKIDTAKNHISVESKGDVTIAAANTMTLKANQVVIQNSSGSVKLQLGADGLQANGGNSMKLHATMIELN